MRPPAPFWLCFFLDRQGRPCQRRTMKAPLEERLCDRHRELAPKPRRRRQTRTQARAYRQRAADRRASAGVPEGW